MGAETEHFEDEFAHHVGAQHAVMVNSGSSANLLIAMGLRELGGEVLVPAVTWPTQVWAWVTAGFEVTLVDVEPHTLNASPGNYEDAINNKTAILSLVHLMGNPCELIPILALADEYKCFITEDCCEALGPATGAVTSEGRGSRRRGRSSSPIR
jgi:Predicted pyridoxal phosphate-dependent enzyme apparently involved in regulation of cell wall biogenesis